MAVDGARTVGLSYPDTLEIEGRPDMLLQLTGSCETRKLHALIEPNWAYLNKFQHLDEGAPTLEAVEATVAKVVSDMQAGTEVQYSTIANGEIVGRAGLSSIGCERGAARLGYWVGEQFQGHGYATAAAERIVRFGFEEIGLETVIVRIEGRNTKSERVARRLGAHLTERVEVETQKGRSIHYRRWEISRNE